MSLFNSLESLLDDMSGRAPREGQFLCDIAFKLFTSHTLSILTYASLSYLKMLYANFFTNENGFNHHFGIIYRHYESYSTPWEAVFQRNRLRVANLPSAKHSNLRKLEFLKNSLYKFFSQITMALIINLELFLDIMRVTAPREGPFSIDIASK